LAASPSWNELPVALLAYDARGQVIEANEAAAALLGVHRESLIGSFA